MLSFYNYYTVIKFSDRNSYQIRLDFKHIKFLMGLWYYLLNTFIMNQGLIGLIYYAFISLPVSCGQKCSFRKKTKQSNVAFKITLI